MFSQLNESDLIDEIINGNMGAFTEFVHRFEKTVSAVVIGMLGKSFEAEEIAQDVFIRFYKTASNFRKESGIKTYLSRIAINLSLNEIKRRKRYNQKYVSLTQGVNEIDDKNPVIENYEIKEFIEKALITLEPKKRSVVVLRLIEGRTTEETAKILNLPVGTVLSRLYRAERELRKLLKGYI